MRNDQIRKMYMVRQFIEYEVIKNVESIQRGTITFFFYPDSFKGEMRYEVLTIAFILSYKSYTDKGWRRKEETKNAKFTTGFICADLQKSGEVRQYFEHIGGCVKYITYVTGGAYFSIGQIVT